LREKREGKKCECTTSNVNAARLSNLFAISGLIGFAARSNGHLALTANVPGFKALFSKKNKQAANHG
jgi:hypothetical protein